MLPSNNDNERLYPLEGLIGLLENCTGLEFTKKFSFSFGKVGQKFTSPNKFELFRIILTTD